MVNQTKPESNCNSVRIFRPPENIPYLCNVRSSNTDCCIIPDTICFVSCLLSIYVYVLEFVDLFHYLLHCDPLICSLVGHSVYQTTHSMLIKHIADRIDYRFFRVFLSSSL